MSCFSHSKYITNYFPDQSVVLFNWVREVSYFCILQLSLLSHSLLRHIIFLVFRLLLITLSQILEDTTSIDQPGLVLNSTFHHLLSVVLSLELKLQLQLLPTDESQVTELEILNALALGCYPTLYSAKE
ncbi:hypothetical protein VNO77_22637 [Canavalia gladiata]|uniref:Uncharacterized protein n=1 Tax=Canavalia gladiata TaxID=3824 RepID=A0AAN9L677_CANGL